MPARMAQNAGCQATKCQLRKLRSNCAERVNSRRVLTNKWADYSTPHCGTGTARAYYRYSCTCTRTNNTTVLVARSLSTKYLVPVLYWYLVVLVQYEYCTAYMKEVGKFNTSGDREC